MVRSYEEKMSGASFWVIIGIASWIMGAARIPSTYLGYSEKANFVLIAFGFFCMILAQFSLHMDEF